jgi:EpsI family protein
VDRAGKRGETGRARARVNVMLVRALIVFVCLIGASALITSAERTEPVSMRTPLAEFPMHVGEWQGRQQPALDERVRRVLGADDYLIRSYATLESAAIGLFIGYWQSQQQGDTIHSPLNCLPGSGWEPLSRTTVAVPVSGVVANQGTSVVVNRYVVQKGLDRQLVLYWYQSHGRVVASEYWSKIYLVADAVRTKRSDAAIVRVIAPIADKTGAEVGAERLATRFVQALFPILETYLPD